jgi:hypothetical protein
MSEFALSSESVLRNLKKAIEIKTNKTMFDLLFLNSEGEKILKEEF